MRRLYLGLFVVCAAIAALAACAASPLTGFAQPGGRISWPPDDPNPRVELKFTYSGTDESQAGRGFFARMGDFFAGSEAFRFVSPYGIAGSAGQQLFVADSELGAVHVVNFEEQTHSLLLGAPDAPMQTPVGVVLLPDGRLFVTDSRASRVHIFRAGQYLRSFGSPAELGRPTGIAHDALRDRLLITDTTGGRVLAYSTSGELLGAHGKRGDAPGQFNYPTNIAVTRDGSIVVVDTMNFRVQRLTPDFEPQSSFGLAGDGPGAFARPKGIGIDSEGHVYVVDAMFDNVQIFDTDGQLLLTFASRGSGFGQLLLPSGIWIDDEDRIVVADSGNSRIQVFQYHTQP